MKEYGIYRRNSGGRPFMIDIYKDSISAKIRINELVSYWEEKGYDYYIDNDYFDNKYNFLSYDKIFYCRIMEREVSEWTRYSEDKEKYKEKDNVIFLNNFKKSIEI